MRKLSSAIVATLIFTFVFVAGSSSFAVANTIQDNKPSVTLTDAQKKEIANLQKDVLDKQKLVISKYVEYGVFTEEKGKKIQEHLDARYKKLENNGFIPQWGKGDKHMKKCKRD